MKFSFWNDHWIENGSLKEQFPDIFNLVHQPNATVAELWSLQGWNLTFRRFLNDWEVLRVVEFYKVLEDFKGILDREDTLHWKSDSKGLFTVKSAYMELNSSVHHTEVWHWKHLWKMKAPFKVVCFCWLVVKEAVLTQQNLQRRGMQLCSRCFLCGKENEINSHLFLHCRVTWSLWLLFLNMKDLRWTMPRSMGQLLACWNNQGGVIRQKKWWRIIPACIWWTIWRERNLRCFEDLSNPEQKIKTNCLLLLHFWCKEKYIEEDATLYVTLEPCPMCAGAILQARVDTVVWGAPNKLLGADGSWIRLFPDGDGGKGLEPTDKPPAPVHPFHPKITIRRGVLASECADVMQQFFQLRRKKKEKKSDPPSPPSCLPISRNQPKLLSKIHDVFHIMFCL